MSHWHVPSTPAIPRPWTADEWQRAQKLKADGRDDEQIAETLGRTRKAVRAKFQKERLTPEQRLRRAEVDRKRRRREMGPRIVGGFGLLRKPREDAIEAFRDRDTRLAAGHRDLTALICGDPPVGFSALDRRS